MYIRRYIIYIRIYIRYLYLCIYIRIYYVYFFAQRSVAGSYYRCIIQYHQKILTADVAVYYCCCCDGARCDLCQSLYYSNIMTKNHWG